VSWVAVGIALVSTAVSVYNTQQTAHKQDNALAAQLRAQATKQHDADAKTAQLIQHEAGFNDKAEKAGSLQKFQQAIEQNKGNAVSPLNAPGAVSDAYKKSGSDAALGITDFGNQFADLVSSIDAPTQARQNDQYVQNKYANDIDQIKRFSQGDDFLAEMRLRGIKRNPWLDAASSVGNAYAGSYKGGGAPSNASVYDSPAWQSGGSPWSTGKSPWTNTGGF